MPRPVTVDNRFTHIGGVNVQNTPDTLDTTEVTEALNGRQYTLGGYDKRASTQRVHTAALGAPSAVDGVTLWQPAAQQIVAIANGDLYYKAPAAADFTLVAAPNLIAGTRVRWARYRAGPSILLFGAGGVFFQWNGAVLNDAVAGAPAGAVDCAIYKSRMFVTAGTKTLSYTAINAPVDFVNGGTEDVETFDAEGIVALAAIGSSLLIAKQNNIARYTGVDPNSIRIGIEQEGVSPTVGVLARHTFISLDEMAFGLSDRGPFLASESGVQLLDLKVGRLFDFANRALLQHATAVYHRGRREVWLSIPPAGEGTNVRTYIYNLKAQAWDGPFVFAPFDVRVAHRYERADGSESVLVGASDGFVRDGDVASLATALDDVRADGTAGTAIPVQLTYPPVLASVPGKVKSLRQTATLSADLGATGLLTASWASELGTGSVTVAGTGTGFRSYPMKWNRAKGVRIVRTLREATSYLARIAGWQQPVAISRDGR